MDTKKYVAVVIVHNLLENDYSEDRIGSIEKAINHAIAVSTSYMDMLEPSEENMVFSFPRDPSVISASIPVIVNVDFIYAGTAMQAKIKNERFSVAEEIHSAMSSLTGERDIIVIIKTALQLAAVVTT